MKAHAMLVAANASASGARTTRQTATLQTMPQPAEWTVHGQRPQGISISKKFASVSAELVGEEDDDEARDQTRQHGLGREPAAASRRASAAGSSWSAEGSASAPNWAWACGA